MKRLIINVWEKIFCKTYFYKWNKFLFLASSKGLGIDNSESIIQKSENSFLLNLFSNHSSKDKLIILDVGANIGDFSTSIKNKHSNSEIFAFEPHPKTFLKLFKNAKENNFNAIQKGCSDYNGSIKFYDYNDTFGSEHATMLKGVFEGIHNTQPIEILVETITIDSFLIENKIEKVDLLKIDTEGFELSVLKGAIESINSRKINAIYFEFNSMNIYSRVFMSDFISLLPNFKLYRSVSNGLVPVDNKHKLLSEIFMFQNIIAILQN